MKVKSDKLKEILASSGLAVGLLGITISTLPKMTVKTENNTIPNTAITDALNDDIPENIQTLLEEIRTYQDATLDGENSRETPGLDGTTIRYHEKIVNPDQSITYMYNNECVKKVSRDTVWFKTIGGSKTFKINNSQYLLPNQATISIVTKRYDDKTKELYRMDGTYTVSEIKDGVERITQLRKKDGTIFKYYYNNWISSIEEVKSIPDYYDTTFDKIQVIINPDGNLLYIQANDKHDDSLENFILYPDGTSRLFKEYERNDKEKETTYEIYKGSLLVEEYRNGKLLEKNENGRRYIYPKSGEPHYEISTEQGITRYTLDDIKYEFEDNDGNLTEYYAEGNIRKIRTVDGKTVSYNTNNQKEYESDKTKSIYYDAKGRITETKTPNRRIIYHENDQIKYKFEEYDNKTGKYKKEYQYTKDGHLMKYREGNITEWYNYDGSLFGKGIDDRVEINYPGSDKPMIRIYGTTVKYYYEQNSNKSREIWDTSEYLFDDIIRYDSEENEYKINEGVRFKNIIEYYPSSNMKSAKYTNDNDYTYVEYYDSPQRKSIIKYEDGKIEEEHEYWENGQLKKSYNGTTNYNAEYFENGIPKYEGYPRKYNTVDDTLEITGGEYEKEYYPKGNPKYIKKRQNGNIYEEYYREDETIELIIENDKRTNYDSKQRINTIETPNEKIKYYYYGDFTIYSTYDKNTGIYYYYYNDELIFSGEEKIENFWTNREQSEETGEYVVTSCCCYLQNGNKIIISEDGVSIEEPRQK